MKTLTAILVLAAAGQAALADDFFEREIRPLLIEKCQSCHGDKKVRGGLKLTAREAVLKGGDSGPALLPGKPDGSLLVRAIQYSGDLRMPPTGKLPAPDIAKLRRWIQQGAPWPESVKVAQAPGAAFQVTDEQRRWWAYQPVREVPPPDVKDKSWARTEIDRFILAELEKHGLPPAPPASRRTLIRRATFDLTGLPPTPEEVEAFVNDPAPDAFAKVVDRLLASPAYGQKWARHWLDVVRYTDAFDTRGAGGMGDISEAWRYRDWVVNAFNTDLPYNEFVMNQIAGDLLPGKKPDEFNVDGLIATGMYVIGNWGNGDADKDKMLTDIVDDQIDVTGRAFLGLTLACARCHDHKFDPIPTEDYYGLAGIFFSSHILPEPGLNTAGSPVLRIPLASPGEVQKRKQHEAAIAALQKQIEQFADEQYG